jgi:Domain of unknown function (DUF4397)
MKMILKKILYNSLLGLTLLTACKKNQVSTIENTPITGAQVKFGYWVAKAINPATQIKIDGQRLSYNLTYAVSFPGGGANQGGSNTNDYLDVPVSIKNLSLSTPNVGTNNDSIVIYTGPLGLAAGQKYSLMFTDSSNVTATLLNDNWDAFIPANNTTSVLRFFNGMPNVPAVDVYFGTSTTPVFTNIAYKAASTTYALIPLGTTNIVLRPAGALPTSTPIVTYGAAIAGGRVYTAIGRGYNGITGTDIRRPLVSIVTNR